MYSDEQLEKLEQEERVITDTAILAMIAILSGLKSGLEKELRSFYQKYGKDGVVTYSEARKWSSGDNHKRRLTLLLELIMDEFDSTHDELTLEFESFLKDVIKKESDFFDVEVDDEPILNEKWGSDELNWKDRLADDVAIWTLYICNDIKQAIHRKATIQDVTDQLDKRFKSIGKVIETLALTESTEIGSMARKQMFKELGFKKYRFYTRADERTCETCGSMHGLVFPISSFEIGVTASPLHPRCRCWEVPIN